jgi:hypothetical protein
MKPRVDESPIVAYGVKPFGEFQAQRPSVKVNLHARR